MAAVPDTRPEQVYPSAPAPRVSVVTSVFNGAAYLDECIQSILNQTFSDFEFILIDDGSSDQSWETIRQYASEDHRIVPIHNELNQGVVAGLNQGLAAARGQYIARQDADDVSLPERIARQVDFLDRQPDYGMTACRVSFIDANSQPVEQPNPFLVVENKEIQEALINNMCLCGPTIMMRRHSLEAAGFWFGAGLDASEDYDLCLRLAEVTRLFNLPETSYLYRQHPQSASRVREYKQVYRKAIALENAVQRRGDAQITRTAYSTLGRDYLLASALAFANGETAMACAALAKVKEFDPSIFTRNEVVEQTVCYRMPEEVDDAIAFVDGFFTTCLPQSHSLKRLRAKLISNLHMKEVFAGARRREGERVLRHLWKGVREDPGWLKNRGVIAIALRYGLRTK